MNNRLACDGDRLVWKERATTAPAQCLFLLCLFLSKGMVEKVLVHKPADKGEGVCGWVVAPGCGNREEGVRPRKEALDDDAEGRVHPVEELALGDPSQCALVLEDAVRDAREPEVGQQGLARLQQVKQLGVVGDGAVPEADKRGRRDPDDAPVFQPHDNEVLVALLPAKRRRLLHSPFARDPHGTEGAVEHPDAAAQELELRIRHHEAFIPVDL